jgi:MFS family permease
VTRRAAEHDAAVRDAVEEATGARAEVRRNTALLTVAQVALWTAIGAFAAFGPITAFELTERRSAAAVFFAIYYLAAATSARIAGRAMDRVGRRPGLAAGYVVLGLGGAVAYLGVSAGSSMWFFTASALIGLGSGAALLGRGAVADMYPAARRGRAVGILLLAGTLGAVGGAPLSGGVHSLAEGSGIDPLAAPWLILPLASAVALLLVLMLRPDPKELAVAAGEAPGPARPAREIVLLRPGLAALVSIGIAQAVMVTFMGVIPVVLHSHHTGEVTVSAVVGLHLGGMFALSPVIGAILDRWGRRAGLLLGAAFTAVGVLVSLLDDAVPVDAVGLFLIGVGWSAAYLGSTAVLSDLTSPAERTGALGLADLVASLTAAAGVLTGGFLFESTGFAPLAWAAIALLVLPLVLVVSLRETSPGRWPAPSEG